MIATKLPSVLQQEHGNSLSMERALRQIKELIMELPESDESFNDKVNASLDDIGTMLANIDRS